MPEIPDPAVSPGEQPVLDRTALERVLARAGELQAGAGEPGDAMTEQELLALAREVGLAPEFVRRALTEERNRVADTSDVGLVARLAGPAWVSAERIVPLAASQALATLDAWMQREECLDIKRRFGDRLSWEARRDLFGNLRRGLGIGGRGYYLSRADEVAATTESVDGGRTRVRLDALLRASRTTRVREGGLVAGLGVLAGAGFVALGAVFGAVLVPIAALAVVPAAAGVGAGWALTRSHGRIALRAQLALEQALDRLEFGPSGRPGLGGLLAAAARAAR